MRSDLGLAALFALFSVPLAMTAVDSDAVDLVALLHGDGMESDVLSTTQRDGTPQNTDAEYAPDFATFDRSILGRAQPGVTALSNNVAQQLNANAGSTQVFVFEVSAAAKRRAARARASQNELRRRDDEDDEETEDTVYVSANTCIQPQAASNASVTAPQMILYVSTSLSNTSPGPDSDASTQTVQTFTEGAVMFSMNMSSDVYIGVTAPNVSSSLSGIYNFELAASTDAYYHSYDNETDANLIWVDSDASAALLMTHNLTHSTDAATQAAIMAQEPYVMFAQNANNTAIDGVRLSYCGLQTYAQIAATRNGKYTSMVATSMTRRGQGDLPKQQFYFSGLNASSSYVGILARLPDNGSIEAGTAGVVGGGGKVSRTTSFDTKQADGNCEVVFNLTFCNETAYAVPSNSERFANATVLAQVYDDYAANLYGVFEKALAQIPCEAPTTQRYSLVRNCTDCAAAYKNWLCSVAIPRCADFSEDLAWLQPRAISQAYSNGTYLDVAVTNLYPNSTAYNGSRNTWIDETIAPGPYKEVLPCQDLCYSLAQSCPAAMGFSCSSNTMYGFNTSYGQRTAADSDGYVTCNYPGAAHYYSAAVAATWQPWLVLASAAVAVTVV